MKWRKAIWLSAVLMALVGCSNRSWNSGDRVLVSKFPYDAGVGEPRRFDVVVFKYPRGPVENGVPKNYIKRLLGLPGQILAIFFGQIFFFEPGPGEPPLYDDATDPAIDPSDLWQASHMHINDAKDLFEEAGKFQILRKPPDVMMAMRRIVYDNDFPAKDLIGRLPPRWNPTAASGWNTDAGNGFTHGGKVKEEGIDWLRYQHITRPWSGPVIGPERKPELITDFMDYNAGIKDHGRPDYLETNWVGDLMLECELKVEKSEGEVWLELSKGIHRFQARFDLSTGTCTLFKLQKIGQKVGIEELSKVATRVRSPGTYELRFANFDARLTVWVNSDLPFGDGTDYPPPEIRSKEEKNLDQAILNQRRGPRAENDLEPASIGSRGASVKINHLRLWRDTHYTQYTQNSQRSDFDLGDPADPSKWHMPAEARVLTMYVQPGHYLCLGDNSPASSDSRDWGLVPKRLLLGRALLVYFPLNRAGPIR